MTPRTRIRRRTPHLSRRLVPAVLAVAVLATGLQPGVAAAGPTAVQSRMDAYLAAHPGGTQIDETDIAYSGGMFIVSVVRTAEAGPLAGPDCPGGWFCFYDGTNYTYPRGRLSDCGWQDLGRWGWRNRTESVHYNLNYGSTTFLDETGSTDTKLFVVDTARRTVPDVSPHRNRADYVYRACS
ncbi:MULTISPECIES: peptidase inhibitor family I36 protein [unclassified Micromonospora]|uniref:peptidase inhibitor family I36 protein n=1 Tax=unclassified Micromonospora TaxID=2617518 RepID=UPI003A83B394